MSSTNVSSHAVDEQTQQSSGLMGKIRESLGFKSEEHSNETVAITQERVAGPGTPSRGTTPGMTCAPNEKNLETWRAAEAETVRAENAGARAEALACEADKLASQAQATQSLTAEASRQAEELRSVQDKLAEEARRRQQEVAELERRLDAARQAVAVAERKRVSILEESRRIKEPAKDLLAEAERLEREANNQRGNAMDLEKEIERIRSGKPIEEAARKEREAARLIAETRDLKQQVAHEEQDAERKQTEAERLQQTINKETVECDELAKKYWEKRDRLATLKKMQKELAGEAVADARDAEKKLNEVNRLEKQAEQAAKQAEIALQKKAEQEAKAQSLIEEKETAEQRAARLEREAAARRSAAGQREEEAHRKAQQAEVVVTQGVPDTRGLESRTAEAREEAARLQAQKEKLEAEARRLEEATRRAQAESCEKVEAFKSVREEATAEKDRQEEHWQRAKELGDQAREESKKEMQRRLEQADISQAEDACTTKSSSRTQTSSAGGVSGDSGSADVFKAGGDLSGSSSKYETQSHVTMEEHSERVKMSGASDAELLKSEGADLPKDSKAGNVSLPGAGRS